MEKFIPALKYGNGSVEVFTTKFDGLFFDSMAQAKAYVSNNLECCWLCETKTIAKSRANDKRLTGLADLATEQAKPLFITAYIF